jgi:hypothetical protein
LVASFAKAKEEGGRFGLTLISTEEEEPAEPAATSSEILAPPGAPPAPDFGSAAESDGDTEISLEAPAE